MKKTIKRAVVLVVVLLASFGAFTGVALAANYITWNGTEDFTSLMNNLQTIGGKAIDLKGKNEEQANEIADLKADKDTQESTIAALNTDKAAKEKEIADLQSSIAKKDEEIQQLKDRGPEHVASKKELEQAEIDMEKANEKSEEVLDSILGVRDK